MNLEDSKNFNAFYRDVFPLLKRRLLLLGCPRNLVRDFFHDSFLIYIEKCKHEYEIANPRGYIIKVAHIQYIKYLRDRRPKKNVELVEDDARMRIIEDYDTWLTLRYYLEKAGQGCLTLFEYLIDKLTYKEIARKMDLIDERNVKHRVFYCRSKLRKMMNRDGYRMG